MPAFSDDNGVRRVDDAVISALPMTEATVQSVPAPARRDRRRWLGRVTAASADNEPSRPNDPPMSSGLWRLWTSFRISSRAAARDRSIRPSRSRSASQSDACRRRPWAGDVRPGRDADDAEPARRSPRIAPAAAVKVEHQGRRLVRARGMAGSTGDDAQEPAPIRCPPDVALLWSA